MVKRPVGLAKGSAGWRAWERDMIERGPATLTLVDDGVATSEEIVSRYTSESVVSLRDAEEPGMAVLRIGSPLNEKSSVPCLGQQAILDSSACRHLARLLLKEADVLDGLERRSADR